MSTDARHASQMLVDQIDAPPQITEPAGQTAESVEVLIRLPDLRIQQSTATSTPGQHQHDGKGASTSSNTNSSGLLGPVLDTLRHRWSTWKSAAMFAQAGKFTRTAVVAGLMLGMVIAAYVIINNKQEPAETQFDMPDTAQIPINEKTDEAEAGTNVANATPRDSLPVNIAPDTAPDWAAMQLDEASTVQTPKTRLEFESETLESDPVRPAIHNHQASPQPDVYSADSRSQYWPEQSGHSSNQSGYSSNSYHDGPTSRSQQQSAYGRYGNSATPGYGQASGQFTPSDPGYRTGYRGSYPDARYTHPTNNPQPSSGTRFRGTIEPPPYRNR